SFAPQRWPYDDSSCAHQAIRRRRHPKRARPGGLRNLPKRPGDLGNGAGNGPAPEPWQLHGERLVYDNQWVRLALVDVEPPGGERFEHHVVRLFHVAITVLIDSR